MVAAVALEASLIVSLTSYPVIQALNLCCPLFVKAMLFWWSHCCSGFFGGGFGGRGQQQKKGPTVHLDLPITLKDIYVGASIYV